MISESTTKYSVVIILVAATIAVTDCAPPKEQENDFEKFLQFVKNIGEEKTISNLLMYYIYYILLVCKWHNNIYFIIFRL